MTPFLTGCMQRHTVLIFAHYNLMKIDQMVKD